MGWKSQLYTVGAERLMKWLDKTISAVKNELMYQTAKYTNIRIYQYSLSFCDNIVCLNKNFSKYFENCQEKAVKMNSFKYVTQTAGNSRLYFFLIKLFTILKYRANIMY